jgi:flavin reductase (DIM6/NTAB) family NADH-FMN oxidoreductase RutF
MDLPWGDPRSQSFITNVGLITSTGPIGPNIMACEWTHHISYKPGFIAICVGPRHATHGNIVATQEFGVSIAASDQNVLASIAGNYSGEKVDKIALLQTLGFRFSPGQMIQAPMVEGAAMQAECRVLQQLTLGDHTMFVGDVLSATTTPGKTPLLYHAGKYWHFGEEIAKPPQDLRDRITKLAEEHQRH